MDERYDFVSNTEVWDEYDENYFPEDEYPTYYDELVEEAIISKYSIYTHELTDMKLNALEFEYDVDTPVWAVLDEVSSYFENRELSDADIYQMYTEIDEVNDILTLTVIYSI